MSIKIKSKIIEPAKVEAGSIFKIKLKIVRNAIYKELAQKTYEDINKFTYNNLKGD